MEGDHRQCTEGSEGLSLLFVPSSGRKFKVRRSVSKKEYMVTSIEVVCKDIKKAVYVL